MTPSSQPLDLHVVILNNYIRPTLVALAGCPAERAAERGPGEGDPDPAARAASNKARVPPSLTARAAARFSKRVVQAQCTRTSPASSSRASREGATPRRSI